MLLSARSNSTLSSALMDSWRQQRCVGTVRRSTLLRIVGLFFVVQFTFVVIYFSSLVRVRRRPSHPPPCPYLQPPPGGPIKVNMSAPTYEQLDAMIDAQLSRGGAWRPVNCTSRDRVAIVVPYRDRDEHLRLFLQHIHPFLQRQLLDYQLFVVEQSSSSPFNRGMLMNIGFVEATGRRQFDCVIFHDVDLLPEDDRNLYVCPVQPRHMSVAVDSMAYRLQYDTLFGGVEAFTVKHFQLINGFSNQFFGWGAEDDNLYIRLNDTGLNLTRYPISIARYRMLVHSSNIPNPRRLDVLETIRRLKTDELDGLNSLRGYRTYVDDSTTRLFTHIYADINVKSVTADFAAVVRDRKRLVTTSTAATSPATSATGNSHVADWTSRADRNRKSVYNWWT